MKVTKADAASLQALLSAVRNATFQFVQGEEIFKLTAAARNVQDLIARIEADLAPKEPDAKL